MADLGRLTATIEARAEKFDLVLQRATQRLDRIAGETERANSRIARSTSGLDVIATRAARGFTLLAGAATAVGGAIAYFAARQFRALDALGDLAQQTGLTATSLRQLQVGLELSGGSSEQASEGLLTFSRNLGQVETGTGRLTGLLKKLDPAFLETLRSAGSTEEALRLFADRIAAARTEQEKLALATAAFGPAGRQFVLLLADGARGVEALKRQLADLGIDNLDEVTEAARRLDDQLKKLKSVVTVQFTKGLFGIGEGMDAISDALDDQTIKNLGIFVRDMGELVGWLTKIESNELAAWSEFFNALRKGEGFSAAQDAFVRLDTTERLQQELKQTQALIEDTKKSLAELGDTGRTPTALPETHGVLDLEARDRRSRIVVLREELAALERERDARKFELQRRQPFIGPESPISRRTDAGADLEPPGARAPESATLRAMREEERERERLRTLDYNRTLEQFRREEKLAQEQAEKRKTFEEQINAAHREATLDRVEMLEFERDRQLEMLDELVGKGTAKYQELAAKIQETFEEDVADAIVKPGEEALTQLTDFGEQVFDDMVQGWVQGADVNFDGILKSFEAMLVKMALAAAAADIKIAIDDSGGVMGLLSVLLGGGGFGGGDTGPAAAEGAYIDRGGRFLALDAALAGGGMVRALVGEGGQAETILRLDDVPDVLARAGGRAGRAADLAKQVGDRVSRPEIRSLMPGDIVVPDSKMPGFMGDVLAGWTGPAFADGGWVAGLQAMPPALKGGGAGVAWAGGGLTVKLEQHVAPDVKASPLQMRRGPDGSLIVQQYVTRAIARDMQTNGPLAQRLAPEGPRGGLR